MMIWALVRKLATTSVETLQDDVYDVLALLA